MMKLLLSLFIMISVLPAMAQRNVGNGGGLAEMKIIYLFQTLDLYLSPCLAQNNPCSLTENEQTQIQEIEKNLLTQKRGAGIKFEHGIEGDSRNVGTWGDDLYLDSQSLYASSGVAKEVSGLGELLIRALLLKISEREIGSLGQKIFADVTEQLSSVRNYYVIVHHLKLTRQGYVQSLLVIEDSVYSLDLTPKVKELTGCKSVQEFNVEQLRAVGDKFIADLTWMCEGEAPKQKGTLIIKNRNQFRLVR